MKKKIQTSRKRLLSVLLAVAMVLTALPLTALSALAATSGDFEYEVLSETDKTCEITGYTGSATTLSVPQALDGYSVIGIGKHALADNTALTSVTLPNSVTELVYGAFLGCTALTDVQLPSTLKSIGEYAFGDCVALDKLTLPDGIEYIGRGVLANTAYAANDANRTNHVLYCGNYLLEAAQSLSGDCAVKAGTVLIAERAFEGCSALTGITIPDSVTSIGMWAFEGCTSLANATLGSGVTNINYGTFYYCKALKSITIPNSVTEIGDWAFCSCTSLASITIPDSVTKIGSSVFSNTAYYNDDTHWESDVLYIGNHLIKAKSTLSGAYNVKAGTKTIAGDAFSGCTALTSINIPNSVTSINDGAFRSCAALTSITIPNSVTYIGGYAFENCTALTSITIPDSVTEIRHCAFFYCSSLASVNIPNSVTEIGSNAFSGCAALTEINVGTGNSNFASVSGVLFNKEKTELIRYPAGKQDSSYAIPNSVTRIGGRAFEGCASLASITIPNSIESIDWGAFANCIALASITIPNSVTSIGGDAFYNCASLASITIPNSVTEIGSWAFLNCTALTSITIPDSVTEIDAWVFGNCTSLTSITIPDSVAEIGYCTFSGCTSLTSITIPDSVTSIDEYAFYDSGLTTIYGYAGSYAETFASENGYTFIALQKLTDTETGVTVGEGSFENLPESTTLNVEKLSAEENAITYDITLTVNGETAQPASAVTVKIPVPETIDGAQCKVYRQETDGTYTDMHATYQNGYMVFTTDHFSTYVLTTEKLDAPTYTLGDLNGDGKLSAVDARFVLQAASGARVLDDTQKAAADVNGDGKINAVDARWILQVASGVRTL